MVTTVVEVSAFTPLVAGPWVLGPHQRFSQVKQKMRFKGQLANMVHLVKYIFLATTLVGWYPLPSH